MTAHLLLDILEENGVGAELPSIKEILEIGKGRIIQRRKKVALINFGTRMENVKKLQINF